MTETINNTHKKIISIYEKYSTLKKVENGVHTVFWFEKQAISYIKKDSKKVTIGFHKGYLIDKNFIFIKTCSKYIRHLKFQSINKEKEKIIKQAIEESISCSIELEEKKKLKKTLKENNANTPSNRLKRWPSCKTKQRNNE